MGKFREFIRDVFSHWEPVMTGVFVSLFLLLFNWLYERLYSSDGLPWYVYVFIAFLCLFYACFRAWLEKDLLLTKANEDTPFSMTIHPTRFSGRAVSVPLFAINKSSHNRIVLNFALYIPLSSGLEYQTREYWADQITVGLGPQEHTSGPVIFIVSFPKDGNTFLFSKAYLLVTDMISNKSAKVKIPGRFPSE